MRTPMRIYPILSALLFVALLSPSYGESLDGVWTIDSSNDRTLALGRDGSFEWVESGVPDEEVSFYIEFSVAPGNSGLVYGFSNQPLPSLPSSTVPATRYKLLAPVRSWEFTLGGLWTSADSLLSLNVSELGWSQVNGVAVVDYVAQMVDSRLTGIDISAEESDELSRIKASIVPMRFGMETPEIKVMSFLLSEGRLQMTGEEARFAGVWRKASLSTAVEQVSWGELKQRPQE